MVLIAAPDGCTAHRVLFAAATRCLPGGPRRPLPVPRPFARLGVALLERLGPLVGRVPFERSWMADYIDRQLAVNAARTRGRTGWAPDPRRSVLATVPAMVTNLRERPEEWLRLRALRGKWPAASRGTACTISRCPS